MAEEATTKKNVYISLHEGFVREGIKYNDRQTGEEKYFNSLRGFRMELFAPQQPVTHPVQPQYPPQGSYPQQPYQGQQPYPPRQQGGQPFPPQQAQQNPITNDGLPF